MILWYVGLGRIKKDKPIGGTKMLQEIIDKKKKKAFATGYHASDEEALGILISQHLGWNGFAICQTLCNALEDANFHTLNAAIQKTIKEVEFPRFPSCV